MITAIDHPVSLYNVDRVDVTPEKEDWAELAPLVSASRLTHCSISSATLYF